MAGPFYNPQAGMGIEAAGASAVVSPVAPVRTSGADAVTAGLNLASQGVSLYGQYQRSQGRSGGTRSGRPDPNLARFSEEVQIALQNKEQFGEDRFKMDMNKIVRNFGSAGQPIDKDMLTYFEQTTGLPSDTYFGIDPVEKFKTDQYKTPEIQAAAAPLIAAGIDPETALNQALEEQQTFQRLSQKLSQTDTQNAVEYMAPNGGQETQQETIQFFRDTVYSRLNALSNAGRATEQDARIVLSNYQALLATPKMQIPSGVSAEVRAQEVAARNNLKGSIETVVKLLDAGEQGQSLLQQIVQNPKMSEDDKKSMFSRFTLLSAKDPFQLMSFMGISDMNDLVKGNTALGKLPPSNFELGNLNDRAARAIATAPPGQNPPPEGIVPTELSAAIEKMTPSALVSFTRGNAKKASFGGFDFKSQEDVEAFATSVYGVAQGLSAPQQNRLRTIDDLGKLLNRNVFKNLDSLDKADPEQAALLRASLGVGLTTELGRRKVQLSSIEKSLVGDATAEAITPAKFNPETGKYELTPEFINSQTPEDMKSFQVGVEYAYGGDLAKGAENNFVRLTTARSPSQGPGDASKVVSDGNLIRIEAAQRNRRATSALRQFYSSLESGGQLPPLAQEFSDPSAEARRVAATVAGTAPMDQGQPMDQPPAAVVQPADQGDVGSFLQRVKEFLVSPAAAAELTTEQRAQLEALSKSLPIPPLPEAELGSPALSILNSYTGALGAEPPRRPEFLEYPSFVRNDETFDLDSKKFETYPTAFTQTALNEDDTPKGLRFEPHIDNVNIFTFGGGVTNLKDVKWTGEDKYGFEKDKFYNKNQIQNKIEANSGSKGEILKGLDTSKAVETSSGLRREKYGDNKSFAYAVYLSYQDRLTDKLKTYDLDTSKLNKNVSEGLTDYFWNYEGFFSTKNSSGVRIAKAYTDGDEDWYKKAWEGTSAMLDNIIAGGTPMLGIAKRRAIEYNMMGPPEGKAISKITLDNDKLNYIAEDGVTILYSRPGKVTTTADLNAAAKQIQAARVDDTPSLSPGEDELNTDLSPVTEQVDPNTVTDKQFIEQMSKSLSETPTEKRVREAKARFDARTAYYKSLNDQAKE
jgi:hypothetical protein